MIALVTTSFITSSFITNYGYFNDRLKIRNLVKITAP